MASKSDNSTKIQKNNKLSNNQKNNTNKANRKFNNNSNSNNPGKDKFSMDKSNDKGKNTVNKKNPSCSYCSINFNDLSELRAHCQTESHQNVIMSDEGRDWKWRCPPRGYTSESYVLCESFSENGVCSYGNQCVEAHGEEELTEWKERFEYRKIKLQKARDKELYGKSYTEQLLEKWTQASSPDKIMKEKLDYVEETCSNELITTVSSKVSKRDWTFVLKTKRLLKSVALLQDAHRTHFTIKQVFPAEPKLNSSGQYDGNKVVEADLTSDQEWVANNSDSNKFSEAINENSNIPVLEHRVKIVFSTDIYGTFRQSVVFDFGIEPILVKHLCIDVVPVTEYDKIQEIKNEILLSTNERWNENNANIIAYTQSYTAYNAHNTYTADLEKESELLERYQCPNATTFVLTQSTITEKKLTKNNYRSRMHELLYIEEIARYEEIARFNLATSLKITNNFVLSPNGMATSTAKYSHSGELFAILELSQDISEDTSAGRLILNNCSSVYLSPSNVTKKKDEKIHVYEAIIEDKSKNMIYLKLSADTVKTLNLKNEDEIKVDIQFQPNRLTYCEWHMAVDKIVDFKIIFPDTYIDPDIPWNPKRQWDSSMDQKLNSKQKEAVVTITSPLNVQLPPILLIGPFGTGKTYTLAQIIKQLLNQSEARILICTHSNSAADLYIKEYLHPWVEEGIENAKPLRVYYHKRWVATVNSVVQKYCLIETKGNFRVFRRPTVEDIKKHKIVVVTLSTSMELASLNLDKGYFTHILLDEAAQAMECEAIMPLALADENTRIVLAGDHMQMSPEIFSNFARERKLHISLLERLYEHYPPNFPTKILLCENYRAHEAIIKFTSELFYDQKLIASGKQPRHDKFYPLTFFTTRGEDIQDKNSTAFYNNSEVYEIVERVCELRKKWPSTWGKFNDQSIGIMTPYADQVFRIRSELRKRRMANISVERVLNVQGKQFRAVFLSTVRTRKTCSNKQENADYGFLSNSKLLNTAITRAQSLVSVVGDPVALCSIGRCRKVWERFIETCHQNKSLFGITWSSLKAQLDGVELRKVYVLNPLAPEFIPRALQTESYLRDQISISGAKFMHMSQQQQPHMPQNIHPMHHPNNQMPLQPTMHPPFHHQHNSMQPMPPQFPQMAHSVQTNFNMNNNLMNSSFRPIGSPSFHHLPPNVGPANGTMGQQFPFNNSVYNYNQQQSPMPPQGHQMPPPPPMPPHAMQQPMGAGNNPTNPMMNPIHPPTASQNMHHNVQPPINSNNMWNTANNMFPALGNPSIEKNNSMMSAWLSKPAPIQQQSPHQIRPPPPPAPHNLHGNIPPANQMLRSTVANPLQMAHLNNQPQNHLFPNQPNQGGQFFPNPQFPQQQQPQQPLQNPNTTKFPNPMEYSNDLAALTAQTAKLILGNDALDLMNDLSGARKSEKDIQFLQNVHFPEKVFGGPISMSQPQQQQLQQQQKIVQPNMPMFNHMVPQQAVNNSLSERALSMYSYLLPPNMSFYDVASESKEFQSRWCMKIMEVYGLEKANKFSEIIRYIIGTMGNHSNKMNATENVLNDLMSGNDFGASLKFNYSNLGLATEMEPAAPIYDNLLQRWDDKDLSESLFDDAQLDKILYNSLKGFNNKVNSDPTQLQQKLKNMDQPNLFQQPDTLQSVHPMQSTNNSQMNFPNERNILNGIDLFNFSKESGPPDVRNSTEQLRLQQSVPLYKRRAHQEKDEYTTFGNNSKNDLF